MNKYTFIGSIRRKQNKTKNTHRPRVKVGIGKQFAG